MNINSSTANLLRQQIDDEYNKVSQTEESKIFLNKNLIIKVLDVLKNFTAFTEIKPLINALEIEKVSKKDYQKILKTAQIYLGKIDENTSPFLSPVDKTIGTMQTDLKKKIVAFLDKDLSKCKDTENLKNRREVIEYFKESCGECTGLSTLWAYGRRLEDSDTKSQKIKDDLAFFNHCHQLLLSWDEISEFSEKQVLDLHRFIGNIRGFQLPSFWIFYESKKIQLDLSLTLEDTIRGAPSLCFEKVDFLCSKQMLTSKFKEIIHPQTMIFLGFKLNLKAHMMAVYKNKDNETLYLYNSNAKHDQKKIFFGEKKLASLEELTEEFWQQTDSEHFSEGFQMLNPLDNQLKSVSFFVYKFSEDPLAFYPSNESFNLKALELIDFFREFPWSLSLAKNNVKLKSFINSLTDKEVFNILKIKKLNLNFKKDLIDCYSRVIDQKNSLVQEITDMACLKVSNRDVKQIKQLTGQASTIKHWFTLNEILLVLTLNPGNIGCIEEFLTDFVELEEITDLEKNKITWSLFLAIYENIKQGTIETAKTILKIVGDNFKIVPSLKQIEDFASVELAQYILENFEEVYKDNYATYNLKELISQLNFKIKTKRKCSFIEALTNIACTESSKRNEEQVHSLTLEAKTLKDDLTLNEALLVLTLNPGNIELAYHLLNSIQEKDEITGSLFLAIYENIKQGTIETAKTILKIIGDKFKMGPSLKQIEKFASVELAQFILENFKEFYRD
jgi:hypothetical protein